MSSYLFFLTNYCYHCPCYWHQDCMESITDDHSLLVYISFCCAGCVLVTLRYFIWLRWICNLSREQGHKGTAGQCGQQKGYIWMKTGGPSQDGLGIILILPVWSGWAWSCFKSEYSQNHIVGSNWNPKTYRLTGPRIPQLTSASA